MNSIYKILCLVTLLMIGCSGQDGKTYFPLRETSTWEYTTEYLISAGWRGSHASTGRTVVRIDGMETINGKKYYKVVSVTTGIPGVEPEINYYRKTSDGIYIVSQRYRDLPEQLYFPASIEIGTTWNVQNPESDFRYLIKDIADAELIDQKYANCLKIELNGTVYDEELGSMRVNGVSYYAPSVGLVKTDMEGQAQGGIKIVMSTYLNNYEI